MGGGKKDSGGGGTTVVNQTTTPAPTAEETAMNQILLGRMQTTNAATTQAQLSGLNVINQLLSGQIPAGPLYAQLTGGVSPTGIANQATTMMRSGRAGAQGAGIAESGEADRAIAQDIAGNLLFPAEQFNIGAAQNMLNLALSGQAQVQAPIQANVGTLGANLQGLRSINTQGTTTTSGYQSRGNPFMSSFMGSLGSGFGSGIGSGLVSGLPGFGAGGIFGGR